MGWMSRLIVDLEKYRTFSDCQSLVKKMGILLDRLL